MISFKQYVQTMIASLVEVMCLSSPPSRIMSLLPNSLPFASPQQIKINFSLQLWYLALLDVSQMSILPLYEPFEATFVTELSCLLAQGPGPHVNNEKMALVPLSSDNITREGYQKSRISTFFRPLLTLFNRFAHSAGPFL